MLLRMVLQSAVFTMLIALGAVAFNGAGMLSTSKYAGWSGGGSSYSSWSRGFADDDDHHGRRWRHDDD